MEVPPSRPRIVWLDVKARSETPFNIYKSVKSLTHSQSITGLIFVNLKPLMRILRGMGGFPILINKSGQFSFKFFTPVMIYSVAIFILMLSYIVYVINVRNLKHLNEEESFEKTVIEYLFIVYLIPIFIVPILWFDSKRICECFNEWKVFEDLYLKVVGKNVEVNLAQKGIIMAVALPLISIGCATINHVTLDEIDFVQIIPYGYVAIITFILSGIWYLVCETIGQAAYILAEDFQKTLKHIGPSSYVANYRALWLRLSNLTRDTGIAFCYSFTFLSLYQFFIITLSIYGFLSQLKVGLTINDIGLTVTALSSIILLFFVCDEAHFASNNVRVNFQKKLLGVELSWMSNDAQTEINMFLKATDLNPTNISLGGFFDVNRGLFKALLTTMVTYLVVLLQFQISIPVENQDTPGQNLTTTPAS